MSKRAIRILEVGAASRAREIGLAPGDQILTLNGREVPDELALRFYLSGENIELCVQHPDGTKECFVTDLPEGADLGITVEEFRTRTCNNSCIFCFIDQLPPCVRPALKVKDDDYRLSFLHGNYITLTNLSGKELDRILEQRLSPLYVSIHATDPQLRALILGRKKADDLEGKLLKLARGGIRLHAQIVLMPGINDDGHLEKTVFDLFRLYPSVQSVAIVPVGLSGHGRPSMRLSPVTPDFCRKVIRRVFPWQKEFRKRTGMAFAYLADEFYMRGGEEIPPSEHYGEFAQIEDGVGMVRAFLDEFEAELSRRKRPAVALHGTLVTGRLFYPTLQACMERFNRRFGARVRVCRAVNRFMGRGITVAGLLAGRDILHALHGKETGNFVIIPQEAVSRGEGVLIDDLSVPDLSERLGKPVYPSGRTVRDFFDLLLKRLAVSG